MRVHSTYQVFSLSHSGNTSDDDSSDDGCCVKICKCLFCCKTSSDKEENDYEYVQIDEYDESDSTESSSDSDEEYMEETTEYSGEMNKEKFLTGTEATEKYDNDKEKNSTQDLSEESSQYFIEDETESRKNIYATSICATFYNCLRREKRSQYQTLEHNDYYTEMEDLEYSNTVLQNDMEIKQEFINRRDREDATYLNSEYNSYENEDSESSNENSSEEVESFSPDEEIVELSDEETYSSSTEMVQRDPSAFNASKRYERTRKKEGSIVSEYEDGNNATYDGSQNNTSNEVRRNVHTHNLYPKSKKNKNLKTGNHQAKRFSVPHSTSEDESSSTSTVFDAEAIHSSSESQALHAYDSNQSVRNHVYDSIHSSDFPSDEKHEDYSSTNEKADTSNSGTVRRESFHESQTTACENNCITDESFTSQNDELDVDSLVAIQYDNVLDEMKAKIKETTSEPFIETEDGESSYNESKNHNRSLNYSEEVKARPVLCGRAAVQRIPIVYKKIDLESPFNKNRLLRMQPRIRHVVEHLEKFYTNM